MDSFHRDFVHVLADKTGERQFDEGDYGGFFPGSVSQPGPPWTATEIELTPTSPARCDVELGIGPIVCHKDWGQPCATDEECRATVCECNSGSRSSRVNGRATPVRRFCQRVANVDCTTVCKDGVKADRAASCLGN